MTYRIKLTPYAPESVLFEGKDTYRVRIVASDAEDMPNEIFVHQQTLVDPYTSTTQDEFIFIATPFDLSAFPANEPNPEQSPAYFRKDTMDILVPNISVTQEVIDDVQNQVNTLVTELTKLDSLIAGTPIWCPSAP